MLLLRRSKKLMIRKPDRVGKVECYGFPLKTPGNWIAIDTETTHLDPWGIYGVDREIYPARPYAFSLCNADGECAYIRWQIDPRTRRVIRDEKTFLLLQTLLGDASLTKVFFNCNFDHRMMTMSGFVIRGPLEDTMLGMHVIHPDLKRIKLKQVCARFLNISADDEKDLSKSTQAARRAVKRAQKLVLEETANADEVRLARTTLHQDTAADYWLADPKLCRIYAEKDAYRTAALKIAVDQEMDEDEENGGGMRGVYRRELRLMDTVRRVEARGVRVDRERNTDIIEFYRTWTADAKKQIIKAGGGKLNPNSPKQMTAEFFGRRKYTPLKYTKKKGKKTPNACQHCEGEGCNICQGTGYNPSCNGDFLEHIGVDKDPDTDEISPKDHLAYWLLHNSAAHTMTGFVESYKELMVQEAKNVWIIHPNYRQAGPITGRFSAYNPNLQNVASDDSGKKRSNVPYRPRECFIPRPGCLFYIPDYSQIEIWILALLGKDQPFIDALCAGGDAHQNVANLIWGDKWDYKLAKACETKDPKSLTEKERKNLKLHKKYRKLAKNLQFCKVYGGGPDKVASMSGTTREEADEFIADYDRRLPGVKRFMKETITLAKRQGYVINPFGRRYPIDRNFAYRATNYLVQGTAAEIIKNAMVRVEDLARTKYEGDMDLLLTIHDELIIEVNQKIHSNRVMSDVVRAMQADYKFLKCPVPFPVGMKIARERWAETQEIKLAA